MYVSSAAERLRSPAAVILREWKKGENGKRDIADWFWESGMSPFPACDSFSCRGCLLAFVVPPPTRDRTLPRPLFASLSSVLAPTEATTESVGDPTVLAGGEGALSGRLRHTGRATASETPLEMSLPSKTTSVWAPASGSRADRDRGGQRAGMDPRRPPFGRTRSRNGRRTTTLYKVSGPGSDSHGQAGRRLDIFRSE